MVGKSGKTTLFYELAKTEYVGGLNKALLLAFEEGYKALRGIHALSIKDWSTFKQAVKQLCEQPKKHTYEWIGLDTLDYLYDYATEYVVRRERIARKNNKIKQIGDIPYGQGYALVSDEVDAQIKQLQNAGFGLFAISHDKEKKIELKDGTSYDKTTLTLPNRAKDLFVNMADFIAYISIEKEVKGKNVEEERWIYFRSDGDIEAGSRFENIVDKVPYGADNFIKAFEDAVLSAYDGDEDSLIEARKKQAEEAVQKEQKEIEKQVKEDLEDISVEDDEYSKMKREELIELVKSQVSKMNQDQIAEFKVMLKNTFGKMNYTTYKKDQLAETLQIISDILEQ